MRQAPATGWAAMLLGLVTMLAGAAVSEATPQQRDQRKSIAPPVGVAVPTSSTTVADVLSAPTVVWTDLVVVQEEPLRVEFERCTLGLVTTAEQDAALKAYYARTRRDTVLAVMRRIAMLDAARNSPTAAAIRAQLLAQANSAAGTSLQHYRALIHRPGFQTMAGQPDWLFEYGWLLLQLGRAAKAGNP